MLIMQGSLALQKQIILIGVFFLSGSQLNKYVLIMQGSPALEKTNYTYWCFFVSGSQLNKYVLIMQGSPVLQKQIILIGAFLWQVLN
jgi:hypothetical protein